MRRKVFQRILLLPLLGSTFFAISAYFITHGQTPVEDRPGNSKSATAQPKQERTYKRGPAGLGVRSDKSIVSFITFDSSDGMHFIKWSRAYESPERANDALENILRKSSEIVKRESVTDDDGQKIGRKIVAKFPPDAPDYGPASLIWTEKEELFEVHSATLQNILEYRKDFKR